jgi:hypothetical protein
MIVVSVLQAKEGAGSMVAQRHRTYLRGGSHGALAAGVALADVGHLGGEAGQVLQRDWDPRSRAAKDQHACIARIV